MGLASKLAAADASGYNPGAGGPPQGGGYPPQQLQAGRPGGAPGGPGSYAPYPGANAGPGGQYPPQGQQPTNYGGPGANDVGAYREMLLAQLREKGLSNSEFAHSARIDAIAQKAPAQVQQLCQKWRVPKEVGQDIVKLALYDIILYVDNSGSMRFEENGERIQDLKLILNRVAYAATLFDDDGISIRFMNWKPYDMSQLDGIKSEQQIEALFSGGPNSVQFSGLTPLGTELRNQVINPMILQKAQARQLHKPVLVITVTDGQPAGENRGTIKEVVQHARNELRRYPQYGAHPIAFQFAQVGNDQPAREFLGELDADASIGDIIDCTSNFENEQVEFMKHSGRELTPDLWLVKLMMGAIDSSYDQEDEKTGSGPRPPPPQQSYGGAPNYGGPPGGGYGQQQQQYPPQQPQYGQQQPQYGQQQQGYGGQQNYNRPPPYPPQQGGAPGGYPGQNAPYPPQQGGRGGGAYPGQQQQQYPPQQGGYPGQQQGGYGGAPPPPPRY